MGFIKNIRNWSDLKLIVFLIAITSSLMVFGYFIYFGVYLHRPLGDVGDWGSFGSYMGSITGLLAFAGVLYTIKQANEKADKAEKDSIKRDERDMFFTMLKMYQRQADSITKSKSFYDFTKYEGIKVIMYIIYDSIINNNNFTLSNDEQILSVQLKIARSLGINVDNINIPRNAIAAILKSEIEIRYKNKNFDFPNNNFFKELNFIADLQSYAMNELVNKFKVISVSKCLYTIMNGIADKIYIDNEEQLGQYFRTIYYILDTISNNIEKDKYSKIFKSQLSKYELSLLLYNAVSNQATLETIKLYKDNNIFSNSNLNQLFLYLNFQNLFSKDAFINMLLYESEKNIYSKKQ